MSSPSGVRERLPVLDPLGDQCRSGLVVPSVRDGEVVGPGAQVDADVRALRVGSASCATPGRLPLAALVASPYPTQVSPSGSVGSENAVSSTTALDDSAGTTVMVWACSTESSQATIDLPHRCRSVDSGCTLESCQRDDGELVLVARAPVGSRPGDGPVLIGRAYRRDGTALMLQVRSPRDGHTRLTAHAGSAAWRATAAIRCCRGQRAVPALLGAGVASSPPPQPEFVVRPSVTAGAPSSRLASRMPLVIAPSA